MSESVGEGFDAPAEGTPESIQEMTEESQTSGLPEAPSACPACGAQLAEGAKFCAECGAQTDPQVLATRAKRKKMKVLGAVLAGALIVGGVAGAAVIISQRNAAEAAAEKAAAEAAEAAQQRAEDAEDLREVFNEVLAIDSAVAVGINQRDYSAKVQSARAAIDSYSAPDADARAVIGDLNKAMERYEWAASDWNDAIISDYRSPDEYALSAAWQEAGESVEAARKKVDAYENGPITQ